MAGAVIQWLAALLLGASLSAAAHPLVRLDHVPTAVRDLAQATADYRPLGFALKPGRPHDNGLRNAHIKFENGAGLELISATEARDALSAHYVDFLRAGEGPAYLTLLAPDEARAAQALQAAGIAHRRDADGLTLTDPRLDWLFFTGDNRSPADRPEHFAHANGAFAMQEAWVALDDAAPLVRLLSALDAAGRDDMRHAPFDTPARVFDLLEGGRIVVVPARHQIVPGHPLIAIVFATRAGEPRWLPPDRTHGLWLGLLPQR